MSFDLAKIEIRHLGGEDIEAVWAIAEILEEAPHWPRGFYEEMLRADSPRPRIALVAWDYRSAGIVGFAIASLIPPEAELEGIAVAAEAQRCGIGRGLLATLVRELRQAGIEELLLEVRSSNHAALHFYQAQNFKQTGVRPGYYTDPQGDAILMSLGVI